MHAHVASTSGQGFATSSSAEKLKLAVVALLLVVAWSFARFASLADPATVLSAPAGVGVFAQPSNFAATPGVDAQHVNVRAGPGAEYRVKLQLDRGTIVVGVARALDTKGVPWIQLSGDAGYVKETVLAPAVGP